jgi:hypothetical protein
MSPHTEGTAANEHGAAWSHEQRSPRASAWRSRSALSVAASLALAGIAVAFGVAHSQRLERDQHPRPAASHSASSAASAHSLEAAATVAAEESSPPTRAAAQPASPRSVARSARPAPKAPKRERTRPAAGAAAQPFPNLSFSAFALPNDFAHETDGLAGDSRSPSPSLPAHDSAPSLNPGLPNNGTTSGSSPNPALNNNGLP